MSVQCNQLLKYISDVININYNKNDKNNSIQTT